MVSQKRMITVDGNEACASVAYRSNEIAVIYPITPSSTMGELADQWAAEGKPNIWGLVPEITEMQSEGGAAGAVHGAIQAGALGTTFTASQGLLLMIPNMYKIAGKLTAFVMHVSARTLATHALSIFGDHSDVMATRQTGFAMLASSSVQEAQDMAAIAQAATLRSRIPFLHFFDGFRTSHEVAKIEALEDDTLSALIDEELIHASRLRALTPEHPVVRGTAQNPDTFFQAQEARNRFYDATPEIVAQTMAHFFALTGRQYHLFDYVGHPEAEQVVVIIGSGAETVELTSRYLNQQGARCGVLKVRLFRPFSVAALAAALPRTVKSLAIMDRCKEAGSVGEPLYLDVLAALDEARAAGLLAPDFQPRLCAGRFGLASKEFTPAMVRAIFEHLRGPVLKRHFTVGIIDDVTGLSLSVDPSFHIPDAEQSCAVFYGLGADGTVGANKNSIKIIADSTPLYAQGYFVYDSKKSGALTISHLRFSHKPIQAPFLVEEAQFVACHHFAFLERYPILQYAAQGATLLLNAPCPAEKLWDELPRSVQQEILDKQLRVYSIDARAVAMETGMGLRINTIMQTCFFALSGVLESETASRKIKQAIEKTYSRKGRAVIEQNFAAVDQALAQLQIVPLGQADARFDLPPLIPAGAPDFVQRVTAMMLAGKGDLLPVSAFPVDGTWPLGTSKYEKRNIANEIPVWEPELCIQCNKCAMVCPHSAIRVKGVTQEALATAPAGVKSMPYKGEEAPGGAYLLQVAPEDCTGCTLCLKVCPGKDKANPAHLALHMAPKGPLLAAERENFAFFMAQAEHQRADLKLSVKTTQLIKPLFEFSGACLGCGETPYIKLLTQLFGDRTLIANATGCSSIFGGNLPTTPYTTDGDGRGPAWSNSLFEDNAEFGLGFRLALDQQQRQAHALLRTLAPSLPSDLIEALLAATQDNDSAIRAQRERVQLLRGHLAGRTDAASLRLDQLADHLVEKVVWIVGGDGWAYDIGYGGLDHVLASGRNVNILVMDTEVYSNTGGQQSKATPLGASAKFAMAGKFHPKKDLGLLAMTYGTVYVASVAFGAKDIQTVRALQEAVSFDGVSLVIAYAPCIAHGYEMAAGLDRQIAAVKSGYWPLYRYDPRKLTQGESPLKLDSAAPSLPLADFMASEGRFRMTEHAHPEHYRQLVAQADEQIRRRFAILTRMAGAEATPGA
jgi:pyruvate-ferredoxin/flavodoxin oxidoreductase